MLPSAPHRPPFASAAGSTGSAPLITAASSQSPGTDQPCTLPAEERPLRAAQWDALFAEGLTSLSRPQPLHLRHEVAGGEGMKDRVCDLAERESDCCSFFTFAITPGKDLIRLDISVDQAYEAVLDALDARTAAAGEPQ